MGGSTEFCFEAADEITGVAEASVISNLRHRPVRHEKKMFRVFQAKVDAVFPDGDTGFLFEEVTDMGAASAKLLAQILQTDIHMVLVQISEQSRIFVTAFRSLLRK